MKLKVSDNLFELNNTDITKINLLIKENFIASENISSFVLNLFDKFNASSFPEVVRKACFFNIIDKNIDENYRNIIIALQKMAKPIDIDRKNIKLILNFETTKAHVNYLINAINKISKIQEFVSFKFKKQ